MNERTNIYIIIPLYHYMVIPTLDILMSGSGIKTIFRMENEENKQYTIFNNWLTGNISFKSTVNVYFVCFLLKTFKIYPSSFDIPTSNHYIM